MKKVSIHLLTVCFLMISLLFPLFVSSIAVSEDNSHIAIGDYVKFGCYPQTKSGKDYLTPIEWLVLDVQDGKALLLSRYGLDQLPYEITSDKVTWETCSVRYDLNKSFLNTAFTPQEQSAILLSVIDNSAAQGSSEFPDTIGGNNTEDKVFLLSYAEAHKYLNVTFENTDNKTARTKPTEYAKKNGAHAVGGFDKIDKEYPCMWWLRSPGYYQNMAAIVDADGSLKNSFCQSSSMCIRPAMWVDLNSGLF